LLKIYRDHDNTARSPDLHDVLPTSVIWLDLLKPTDDEIAFVERQTKVRVPNRDALSEIEVSSRLAKEGTSFT
jgi:magnesium transporter